MSGLFSLPVLIGAFLGYLAFRWFASFVGDPSSTRR